MRFLKLSEKEAALLEPLQRAYKEEIGEEPPTGEDFARLAEAIKEERILFFGCMEDGKLIACCSVTVGFSTFDYLPSGVFEDFYIVPAWRHRSIARELLRFAYRESGVSTLSVGSADCDEEMYRALGFAIPLGRLLAFDAEQ